MFIIETFPTFEIIIETYMETSDEIDPSSIAAVSFYFHNNYEPNWEEEVFRGSSITLKDDLCDYKETFKVKNKKLKFYELSDLICDFEKTARTKNLDCYNTGCYKTIFNRNTMVLSEWRP